MKRKLYLTAACACILFLMESCEKLVEVTPLSSITEATYFQTEGDFEPYLIGIYSQMRTTINNVAYGTERGDELITGPNSRFSTAWTHILSPSVGALNYNEWYRAIGNCNLLLTRIETFPFASNPDLRRKILAETYSLRALFYFHLTKIIGDAPIMLEAITNDQVPLLPRAQAADVMKQIFADLDAAINEYSAMAPALQKAYPSKYRFSYGATQALKADAKLWSAKVLGGGAADLNDVLTALTEVESTAVSLNTDFKNVTGVRGANNPEVIMATYYHRDETAVNASYLVNALPQKTFVLGALNIDSIPFTDGGNGQTGYQISTQSRALFTDPNDKRIPFTWVVERQASGPKTAWITKYPGTRYADDRYPDNDLILYRLADVFLMKAEAYAALNNITSAVEYLDKVRLRANTGNYSGSMDKASVEKEILDERGRELFFENKRWFDLVRFHNAGTIDVYTYVPNLAGKTTPLYWPLSPALIAINPQLTQTAGY